MHIDQLVSQFQSKKTNHRHVHKRIWKNIKDLLKCCIGLQSTNCLLNNDGSLIDRNHLNEYICSQKQTYQTRQITWPYLLHLYSPAMTNSDKKLFKNRAKNRYHKLKGAWQERVSRGDPYYVKLADTILKDVRRTDRHLKFLKNKKQILFNIMMTYSVYHPNPGYSQGMSDMLTPIIYIFNDESMSYLAYCSLMNRYMNLLFDQDQIEINHRMDLFHFIFQSIDSELWKKIHSNEENYLIVYRWLLLDCKREFDQIDHIVRVLELIWIHSIPSTFSSLQSTISNRSLFTIFVCIAILQGDRHKLISCSNEEDLNKYFFSSSSSSSLSRSSKSIKRILERAQIYYSNYISSPQK